MLGILVLDTAFPRIPGDVGAPETFPFPVRHAVVRGASVDDVVHAGDRALLPHFIATAKDLQAQGCTAIATTCGFLAPWQDHLAAALDVPVLTSALLQWPLVQRVLPRGTRAGIVTYSEASVSPEVLAAASIPSDTPIAGVDPTGYFARTIRNGAATLDPVRMRDDVVAAARQLVTAHPNVGAIVLECANMPPYATAVAQATRLPVFDAVDLLGWFHAAAERVRGVNPPSPFWRAVSP